MFLGVGSVYIGLSLGRAFDDVSISNDCLRYNISGPINLFYCYIG